MPTAGCYFETGFFVSISDDLTALANAAPDLVTAPDLALGVAKQGGDVGGNGQATAQAVRYNARDAAAQQLTAQTGDPQAVHHSVLWHVGKFFTDLGSGAAHLASMPLGLVQHEYRYFHDIEARHGALAAVLSSLGMTAGAVVGGAIGTLAGPAGTAFGASLGATLAGKVTGNLAYKDSWDRTTNGDQYRDPHTGQAVSLGRDIGHVLGLKGGAFTALSGTVDGIFDLATDPLTYAMGVGAAARGAEGLGGVLASRFPGLGINKSYEGVLDAFSKYPSFRRAAGDIAKMDAGTVAARYPQFSEIARELGAASTPDDVAHVFGEAAQAYKLRQATMLPSMTLSRQGAVALSRKIQGFEGPGSRLIAAMTTKIPETFDPELKTFSNKEFNPGDDYGANGIYRTLRMGETDAVARSVTDTYVNTVDPGLRRDIYLNALTDAIIARAKMVRNPKTLGLTKLNPSLEMTPEDVRNLRNTISDMIQNPGRGGVYAGGRDGRNISELAAPDGTITGAVLDNQLGKWAFPDYKAFTRVAQEVAGAKHVLGNLDDFAYHHITQNFFKRWVLFTPSFALHVAFAELIPSAMRLGITDTIKSTMAVAGAKAQRRLDSGELGAMKTYVYRLLGSPAKFTPGMQEDIEDATKLGLATDGHFHTPGVSSGHNIAQEHVVPQEAMRRTLRHAYLQTPPNLRSGENYALFGTESTHYNNAWHDWLRDIASDEKSQKAAAAYLAEGGGQAGEQAAISAVKDHLDQLAQDNPRFIQQFARHFYPAVGHEDLDPHTSWAKVATENMLAAVTGKDGTVHNDLLQRIAAGDPASLPSHKALDAIDEVSRPVMVMGREYFPDSTSTLERFANVGYRRVISPIVNHMARDPVFFGEFKNQYRPLKAAVAAGHMTDDEAINLALTRSTAHMIKFVHNINERSQFAQLVRNAMPFYFAQEQAYKRVGRLLGENPAAFRRFQLILSGLNDIGHQTTDAGGNDWLVLPGTGWLGTHVPGILSRIGVPALGSLPVGFAGSLQSANVIFPFAEVGTQGLMGLHPGMGPLVTIPVKALTSMFPSLTPQARGVIGDIAISEPMWKQFVPNVFVQRALETAGGMAGAQSPGFQSAMMQAIQLLDYQQNLAMDRWVKEGHSPTDPGAPRLVPPSDAGPMEMQQFINRVKNHTVILYATKSLLGLVSPLSPQLKIEDYGLPEELRTLITKTGSINAATQQFLAKHPDATPWTVYQSHTNSAGSIPANVTAQNWINANMGLIQKYPYAAMYLMPPAPGNFDSAIYHEQIAQGLRVKDTPLQFLQDLYIAAGNRQYFDVDKPAYEAAQKQYANDPAMLQTLAHRWQAYQQQQAAQNPVWWDYFTSTQRTEQAKIGVAQLQEMAQQGLIPNSAQGTALRSLLNDYATYVQSLQASSSYHDGTNTTIKNRWQAYLTQLKKQDETLAPVINKMFVHL